MICNIKQSFHIVIKSIILRTASGILTWTCHLPSPKGSFSSSEVRFLTGGSHHLIQVLLPSPERGVPTPYIARKKKKVILNFENISNNVFSLFYISKKDTQVYKLSKLVPKFSSMFSIKDTHPF